MGHSISLLKRKYVWLQGDTDEALAALKEDLVAALPKQKVIANNRIVISKDILSGGEYGVIYRGTLDKNPVAIKQAKSEVEYIKGFLSEIKVTHFIGDHPNIVQFHGAVVDGIQHRVCLAAFELSSFGNLNNYLKEHDADDNSEDSQKNIPGAGAGSEPKTALKQSVLINYCKQIATAMAHIAEKKVVHRDLSARSILVFQNNVVKISDFGMSRKLYDSPNYVQSDQNPMPWRWMSPESFRYMQFSSQSDVWSFGVTLWEIFTFAQLPFSDLTWSSDFADQIQAGLRLSKPKHVLPEVFDWMKKCWEFEPERRPSFLECQGFFTNIQLKVHMEDNIYGAFNSQF